MPKQVLRIPRTDVRIVTGIDTRMEHIPMLVSGYKVRCGITCYTLRTSPACVASRCVSRAQREGKRAGAKTCAPLQLCDCKLLNWCVCVFVFVGTFSVLGIAQTSRMAPEWFGERPNVSCLVSLRDADAVFIFAQIGVKNNDD